MLCFDVAESIFWVSILKSKYLIRKTSMLPCSHIFSCYSKELIFDESSCVCVATVTALSGPPPEVACVVLPALLP